jgi:hypothetical protein
VADPLDLIGLQSEAACDALGEHRDALEVQRELRVALGQRAHEDILALARGRRASSVLCAYMRWSAIRSASVAFWASRGSTIADEQSCGAATSNTQALTLLVASVSADAYEAPARVGGASEVQRAGTLTPV